MPETLTETFARFAEDADFRQWNEGRTVRFRFIYARQSDNVWKFTLDEWWRIVSRAIRNNGASNLPSAKQLRGQAKKIADVENGYLDDNTIRIVSLVRWTMDDWKNELAAI